MVRNSEHQLARRGVTIHASLNRAQMLVAVVAVSFASILVAIVATPAIVGEDLPSELVKEGLFLGVLVAFWSVLSMLVLNGWDSAAPLEFDEDELAYDTPALAEDR